MINSTVERVNTTQHNKFNNLNRGYQRTSSSRGNTGYAYQKSNPEKLVMLLKLIMQLIQQLSPKQSDAPLPEKNSSNELREKNKTNSPQVKEAPSQIKPENNKQSSESKSQTIIESKPDVPPKNETVDQPKATKKSELPHVTVSDPEHFVREEKSQAAKQPVSVKGTNKPVTTAPAEEHKKQNVADSLNNSRSVGAPEARDRAPKATEVDELKVENRKASATTTQTENTKSEEKSHSKEEVKLQKQLDYVNGKSFISKDGTVTFKDGKYHLESNDGSTKTGSYGIRSLGSLGKDVFFAPDQTPFTEQVGADKLIILPKDNSVSFGGVNQFELQLNTSDGKEFQLDSNQQRRALDLYNTSNNKGDVVRIHDTNDDGKISKGDLAIHQHRNPDGAFNEVGRLTLSATQASRINNDKPKGEIKLQKQLDYINGQTFSSNDGTVTFKDGRFDLQLNNGLTDKGSYGISQGTSLFTLGDQSPNSEQIGSQRFTILPNANSVMFRGQQYELQPKAADGDNGVPDSNGVIDEGSTSPVPIDENGQPKQSNFYDWFKETYGDFNNDGEVNKDDVVSWLKEDKKDNTDPISLPPVSTTDLDSVKTPFTPLTAGSHFTLDAPKGSKYIQQQGFDSIVGQIKTPDYTVRFDKGLYGGVNNQFDGRENYQTKSVEVDGKDATLATYFDSRKGAKNPYRIAITIPLSNSTTNSLTLHANLDSAEKYAEVEKLFRSIKVS